jgi:hypothetical protein
VSESLSRESKWGRALTSLRIVIFQAKMINGSDPIWEAASGSDGGDLNLVVVQESKNRSEEELRRLGGETGAERRPGGGARDRRGSGGGRMGRHREGNGRTMMGFNPRVPMG